MGDVGMEDTGVIEIGAQDDTEALLGAGHHQGVLIPSGFLQRFQHFFSGMEDFNRRQLLECTSVLSLVGVVFKGRSVMTRTYI
jgi:hypothetical protein